LAARLAAVSPRVTILRKVINDLSTRRDDEMGNPNRYSRRVLFTFSQFHCLRYLDKWQNADFDYFLPVAT